MDPTKISTLPQSVIVDPCPDIDIVHYLKTLDNSHCMRHDKYSSSELRSSESHNNNDVKCSDGGEVISKELPKNSGGGEENECKKENDLDLTCKGKLVQNYDSQSTSPSHTTSTSPQGKTVHDEEAELPAEFYPLVLLVAGLRPVKVRVYVDLKKDLLHTTN